jgi:hypothetical protein
MSVDTKTSVVGISYAALPRRNYQPASICIADLEAAAKKLHIRPRTFELKPAPGKYRFVSLQLPSGRYATLTQWVMYPESIEISLELVRDNYFFETDLLAILEMLGIQPREASRQRAFKWK